MAFPTTGLLDAFADTEGPPMTGWATPALSSGVRSASGVALANAANAIGIWNSVLSGADCEAYATLTTAAGLAGVVYLFARAKDTANVTTMDGYGISVTEAATDTWSIIIMTNGVVSSLGATFNQEVANGDSIGVECIGSTIAALYKPSAGSWTQLTTRTDTTYAAAGYIGLGFSDTTARMGNFSGGNVVAGHPAVKRMGGVKFAHRLGAGVW